MRVFLTITLVLFFSSLKLFGQHSWTYDGQLSTIGSYTFDQDMSGFAGVRYIPEVKYNYRLDTLKNLTVFGSVNTDASALIDFFDSTKGQANFAPYRFWGRYATRKYEIRLGLQKIDFGSATLMRPLQWFNQIDPRDPLQLTNGVYAALGRYYFSNNANIWLWALYGNDKRRGFDALPSVKQTPEFGGRFQWPAQSGEMAVSYHFREADNTFIANAPPQVKEHRMALDGKFDATVGLWFESSYTYKERPLQQLTHQTMLNMGTDYTFGIGSGLTATLEHLVVSFDRSALNFANPAHITALMASYPLSFFDNLSLISYYNWESQDITFFVNYQHTFSKWLIYVMPYYNPATGTGGIVRNDLVNNFAGPGLRLMAVFNH